MAFYGVVPDGPEGTLATVTEFMVNGSLRHVLVKKEKYINTFLFYCHLPSFSLLCNIFNCTTMRNYNGLSF